MERWLDPRCLSWGFGWFLGGFSQPALPKLSLLSSAIFSRPARSKPVNPPNPRVGSSYPPDHDAVVAALAREPLAADNLAFACCEPFSQPPGRDAAGSIASDSGKRGV